MQTIRFDEKDKEKGLRTIILNGMVEYTGEKGVYRVPNYVLELLKGDKIRYHPVVEPATGSERKKATSAIA